MPISQGDKRTVARKAAAGKMSMAEFARRAVMAYDPGKKDDKTEAELRAVLEAFKTIHAQTIDQLDRTDAALEAALAHFGKKRSA